MIEWKPYCPSDHKPLAEGSTATYTKKKNYLFYIPDDAVGFRIVHGTDHSLRYFSTPIHGGEWITCPTFYAEINIPVYHYKHEPTGEIRAKKIVIDSHFVLNGAK